jgi:ubiquitin carboxyl-terminal hydrolase 22/27/51
MQPLSDTGSAADSSSGGKSGNGGSGKQQQQQQQLYDLFGVVVHKGSLNSGHYISYVQGHQADQHSASAGNNKTASTQQQLSHQCQWLKCDDETITGVSMEEVRNVEGYILFYVRKQQQQQ